MELAVHSQTLPATLERRQNPRQPRSIKTRVVQCGIEYTCEIVNISIAGACLVSPCHLSDMQLLRLDIDGFGGVTGIVRWTAGEEAGIEFQMDTAKTQRLDAFLDQLTRTSAGLVQGSA